MPVDDAIDYFTTVIKVNPNDAHAYNCRVRSSGARIRSRAIGPCAISVRRSSWAPRPLRYTAAAVTFGADRREYDKAIADYGEAIRLDPQDASVFEDRGTAWYLAGRHDNAIADFTEALRLNPTSADAHNCRGLAWHAKVEYDKAIADYNEAIRLDPNPATYSNRGKLWYDKREYDKAIADFSEDISRSTSDIAQDSRLHRPRSSMGREG